MQIIVKIIKCLYRITNDIKLSLGVQATLGYLQNRLTEAQTFDQNTQTPYPVDPAFLNNKNIFFKVFWIISQDNNLIKVGASG